MRHVTTIAALFLFFVACDDDEVANPPDGGGEDGLWAPWPVTPGNAGLEVVWQINGSAPTEQSCREVNLGRIELWLVHPVAEFKEWSTPELQQDCLTAKLNLTPDNGLAPGKYRFIARQFHRDGTLFSTNPMGECTLVEGGTTTILTLGLSKADQP